MPASKVSGSAVATSPSRMPNSLSVMRFLRLAPDFSGPRRAPGRATSWGAGNAFNSLDDLRGFRFVVLSFCQKWRAIGWPIGFVLRVRPVIQNLTPCHLFFCIKISLCLSFCFGPAILAHAIGNDPTMTDDLIAFDDLNATLKAT